MILRPRLLAVALLAPMAWSGPAIAQAIGNGGGGGAVSGAASTPITPAPTVQPASGSGQVRQPPQNSAMRGSGGFSVGTAVTVNPAGMAGMGTTGSGTNMLTLSAGGGGSSRGGGMSAQGGTSAGQRGSVSVSDTGVTQRTPTGSSGQR